MSRSTVAGALLVLTLALGATASGASAAKLTLSEGGVALAPGAPVFVEEGRIQVFTSEGPIACSPEPEIELNLAVVTNSKGSDELGLKGLSERQEFCRSFTGNAEVLLESLGSFLKVNAKGQASVGLHPSLTLVFEHEEYAGTRYEGIQCNYGRERLRGTNTATPSPQALQIAFEGALALHGAFAQFGADRLSKTNARHLCPEAELSVSLPSIEGETGVIQEQVSP
ncbi:MAG: hypothetical protein ACYDHT_05175 [Solirubrobacteraceae bacterium]